MPFGVILQGSNKNVPPANFYIPTASDRSEKSCWSKSSHIYLESRKLSIDSIVKTVSLLGISSRTTVIVRVPQNAKVPVFLRGLATLHTPFAVIVPMDEDIVHWAMLKDAYSPNGPSLILEYRNKLSGSFRTRYKCLKYSAILVSTVPQTRDPCFASDVTSLLMKKDTPALLLPEDVAQSRPVQFWAALASPTMKNYSDVLIDALQPLSINMLPDVYETFQKDRTKYAQYDCAIELALSDLHLTSDCLDILIIGPGMGPLLESVLKYATQSDKVVAVEKNEHCLNSLDAISRTAPCHTTILHADVRSFAKERLRPFRLVVSELLGSFGCNEAAPEILAIFDGLSPVMIPQEVTSFIHPIYTDLNLDTETSRPYLCKLNSSCTESEPLSVFQFTYPGTNQLTSSITLDFPGDNHDSANALCGYFRAILYGPYNISILPNTSSLEKCTSWFPMIFPIPETRYPMRVTIERKSSKTLTYEWTANGQTYGHNYHVGL